MDSPVAKLLAAQTDEEANTAFGEFGMKLGAADVWPMLAAFSHPNLMVRYHAVYLLGDRWKDKRVIKPLLAVLRNREEDAEVRGTAADQLAHHRGNRRRIVSTLIEVSRDPDPVVRFWCVFALGSQLQDGRIPSQDAIRALEERVEGVKGWTSGIRLFSRDEDNRRNGPTEVTIR